MLPLQHGMQVFVLMFVQQLCSWHWTGPVMQMESFLAWAII